MSSAIGLIIAAHGTFAQSLVDTVELIMGGKSRLQAFDFPAEEAASVSARRLRALIKKCDQGHGVIILSDLFGGTPGSLALSMVEAEAVEVITGVNLPMALTAATLPRDVELGAASETLMKAGRESIKEAGQLLKANP